MTNNFVSSPAWIADADPIESWRTLMRAVNGTTTITATTDVNGTSGRQGATGSVSGNDETPAPSSCAKVILRQDSCASCSCAPPLPVMAVPALLFLCRLFLRRLFLHSCSCTPIRTPPVPTTDACSKIRRSPT